MAINDYYDWTGRTILPYLCSDVLVHRYLYNISDTGRLIELESTETFSSTYIGNLHGAKGGPLSTELAYVEQKILESCNIPLVPDAYRIHMNNLVVNHMLYSSLCYVQKIDRQGKITGFFATKQKAVVEKLRPNIHKDYVSKLNTDYFSEQYETKLSEIVDGKHSVIAFKLDMGGFILSKRKLQSSSKNIRITPMYILDNYSNIVIRFLKNHVVSITFVDGKETFKLKTSLKANILSKYLGIKDKSRIKVVQNRVDPMNMANIIIPNLETKKFVTVNLFQVISLDAIH